MNVENRCIFRDCVNSFLFFSKAQFEAETDILQNRLKNSTKPIENLKKNLDLHLLNKVFAFQSINILHLRGRTLANLNRNVFPS